MERHIHLNSTTAPPHPHVPSISLTRRLFNVITLHKFSTTPTLVQPSTASFNPLPFLKDKSRDINDISDVSKLTVMKKFNPAGVFGSSSWYKPSWLFKQNSYQTMESPAIGTPAAGPISSTHIRQYLDLVNSALYISSTTTENITPSEYAYIQTLIHYLSSTSGGRGVASIIFNAGRRKPKGFGTRWQTWRPSTRMNDNAMGREMLRVLRQFIITLDSSPLLPGALLLGNNGGYRSHFYLTKGQGIMEFLPDELVRCTTLMDQQGTLPKFLAIHYPKYAMARDDAKLQMEEDYKNAKVLPEDKTYKMSWKAAINNGGVMTYVPCGFVARSVQWVDNVRKVGFYCVTDRTRLWTPQELNHDDIEDDIGGGISWVLYVQINGPTGGGHTGAQFPHPQVPLSIYESTKRGMKVTVNPDLVDSTSSRRNLFILVFYKVFGSGTAFAIKMASGLLTTGLWGFSGLLPGFSGGGWLSTASMILQVLFAIQTLWPLLRPDRVKTLVQLIMGVALPSTLASSVIGVSQSQGGIVGGTTLIGGIVSWLHTLLTSAYEHINEPWNEQWEWIRGWSTTVLQIFMTWKYGTLFAAGAHLFVKPVLDAFTADTGAFADNWIWNNIPQKSFMGVMGTAVIGTPQSQSGIAARDDGMAPPIWWCTRLTNMFLQPVLQASGYVQWRSALLAENEQNKGHHYAFKNNPKSHQLYESVMNALDGLMGAVDKPRDTVSDAMKDAYKTKIALREQLAGVFYDLTVRRVQKSALGNDALGDALESLEDSLTISDFKASLERVPGETYAKNLFYTTLSGLNSNAAATFTTEIRIYDDLNNAMEIRTVALPAPMLATWEENQTKIFLEQGQQELANYERGFAGYIINKCIAPDNIFLRSNTLLMTGMIKSMQFVLVAMATGAITYASPAIVDTVNFGVFCPTPTPLIRMLCAADNTHANKRQLLNEFTKNHAAYTNTLGSRVFRNWNANTRLLEDAMVHPDAFLFNYLHIPLLQLQLNYL